MSVEGGWAFRASFGDRSLFPDLEYDVYANHAAISPPSNAVRHAITALLDDYARHGAASFPTWAHQRRRLKDKLGQLINVSSNDLALVQSTTVGALYTSLCYPWQKGDKVVCFLGEFPANVTPWQRAASVFGLDVALLPQPHREGDEGFTALSDHLQRGGVKVVAVSAVQFQTGVQMPLAAITKRCHEHGAEVFVDAVQALGCVPLDAGALGVDYLACGSHKWMMGVEGAGFLYVRPDRTPALRPNVAGWLSHEEGLDFLLRGPGHLRYDRPIKRSIDFLEGANLNAAGFAALEATLDVIQSLGAGAIYEHVQRILDVLEPALVERGFTSHRPKEPSLRSGIASFSPPKGIDVVALHRATLAHGTSCSIPDGFLRFSPHWPNHVGEVPQILASIDKALAEVR